MCRNRNPLLCAVPPYVLHEVAARGTERQRKWALKTLSADTTIRPPRAITTRAGGRKARREGYDALAAAAKAKRNRVIWDARHSYAVSGLKRVRDEGDPPVKDKAVNEAFDGLGETWDFWLRAFSRDSIDDENMPMRGIVHYGEEYPNAFWDGRRMVFGDGDGMLFTRFTRSLDVIGHELGHGVIEDEAALTYQGQSGALNESVADVFGSLVKQFTLGQDAAAADWLIGADLRGPDFHGAALRSMIAPGTAYDDPVLGKDPQPDHMDGFVQTEEDNGGVHLNSGIPNKAFATLARDLGGNAWERAGSIWYQALRDDRLGPNATFAEFAAITRDVAGADADAVAAAW